MLIAVVTTGSPGTGCTAKVADLLVCAPTEPDGERMLTGIHLLLEVFFSDRLIGVTSCPWSGLQQNCSICKSFEILSCAISASSSNSSIYRRRSGIRLARANPLSSAVWGSIAANWSALVNIGRLMKTAVS